MAPSKITRQNVRHLPARLLLTALALPAVAQQSPAPAVLPQLTHLAL